MQIYDFEFDLETKLLIIEIVSEEQYRFREERKNKYQIKILV